MGDEPSAPGYMMLYGLLMTLLMTFFILLTSMGTQQQDKKMNEVITSIKSAFGSFGEGGAGLLDGGGSIVVKPDVVELKIMQVIKKLKMEDLQGMEIVQTPQKPTQPVRVKYDPLGRLHISFPETLFFKDGQDISDKAKSFLEKMLALYFDTPYGITILGVAGGFDRHTSWKKAFERARTVMDYLHKNGVPFVHLYPEAKTSSDLNKAVRVEIVLRLKDIL